MEFSTTHEPRDACMVNMPSEASKANTALIESARIAQDIAQEKGDTTTLDLLFELTTTHQRFLQTLSSLEA